MRVLIVILCLFLFNFLSSTIINIPADQPNIQAGIDASVNADTVLVQPGTYFENVNFIGKNITVASIYLTTQDTIYISQTIIDGNQLGSVVTFESGEDSTAVLSGFTIKNGNNQGGGINCVFSSPQLNHLIVTENQSNTLHGDGGGIRLCFSSSVLTNVIIEDNFTSGEQADGGAIYCGLSNPILHDVVIKNNSTIGEFGNGGGIFCTGGSTIFMYNVLIENNSAANGGGGIICHNSTCVIENSTIFNNFSNVGGAGIYSSSSNLELENVVIQSNHATSSQYNPNGGGIYSLDSEIIMENVNLQNNISTGSGAGLYQNNSNVIISNTSISGNDSDWRGGGIYCAFNSNLNINNSVITSNAAVERGGGIYIYESQSFFENVEIDNNDVDSYGGGILIDASSFYIDKVEITNNFAHYGGGIYFTGSDGILVNSIISNNSAQLNLASGGGIVASSSDLILKDVEMTNNTSNDRGGAISCISNSEINFINATISNNSAINGGGIYCKSNCNIFLTNSILWNNDQEEVYFNPYNNPSSISILYSNISGGETSIVTNNNGSVNWSEGNIDDDPLFLAIGENPFSLSELSPCIDSGTPDTTNLNLPPFDLAGNDRVYGGRIDMGAYEWQGTPINSDELAVVSYELSNFPNPFNPSTTISFNVTQTSSFATIEIYNLKGQKVKFFPINSLTDKPINSVTWSGDDNDGNTVSSGVYLYKLNMNGKTEAVKKCLLLK